MKRIVMLLAVISTAISVSLADDYKRTIKITELPKVSQEFIKTHLSGWKVKAVYQEMELDHDKGCYKVKFKAPRDMAEVKFKTEGEWLEVDGNGLNVPMAILPAKAIDYMVKNHPGTTIIKVEKDYDDLHGKCIKVDVIGDRTLIFNNTGEFVALDVD